MINPSHLSVIQRNFDTGLIEHAESLGHGELHCKFDAATGLRAIVAIHSTHRGPALGGCRCLEYTHVGDAIEDAMRLARGMSYKAAITNLPLGGGKAVLLKPRVILDRQAYFKSFGRFIHDLAGRYITAVDSGTSVNDMDDIATQTSFVTCNTQTDGTRADPSPFTAYGVCQGIQAAVQYKFKTNSLENIHVVVQGLGQVGYHLAAALHQLGAKLSVCDVNPIAVQRCVDEFAALPISLENVYKTACDVYAPCALGATVSDESLKTLNTHIIAGSANNQLAHADHGRVLHTKGILYAPDYVINAGGLVHAYAQYAHISDTEINQKIAQIYDTLWTIFERSQHENKATSDIADEIAAARIMENSY